MLPDYSIQQDKKNGFLVVFNDAQSGKRKRLRAYPSSVPRSKQTKTGAKKRAEAVVTKYLQRAHLESAILDGKVVTVGDFFDRVIEDPGSRGQLSERSIEKRAFSLAVFEKYLGDRGIHREAPITKVTRKVVEKFVSDRMKGGVKLPSGRLSDPVSATGLLTNDVGVLRRAFNYLILNDDIEGVSRNPFERIVKSDENSTRKRRKRVEKTATEEELQALLEGCQKNYIRDNRGTPQEFKNPPYLYAMIFILSKTGMRPGELRKATWKTVDQGFFRLEEGKTNERDVVISGELQSFLEEYRANLKEVGIVSDYIICKEDGKPLGVGSDNQAFKRLRERLGLREELSLYSFRHRYGTKLGGELPLPVVAAAMGHRDIRTTMVYASVSVEEVADQIAGVDL